MRLIDADALDAAFTDLRFSADGTLAHWGDRPDWCLSGSAVEKLIENAPTIGGWINNYEWICPACGTSILVKTFKQSKAIGMKLTVCPGCGKEILYGKAD